MKLHNKVCLVTGFARDGGKVAVPDLQIEAAHRTVAEIEIASHGWFMQ